MDKNNTVALALLKIRGCNKKAQVQAHQRQHSGQGSEHRPKPVGKRIKRLRCSPLKPANSYMFHLLKRYA